MEGTLRREGLAGLTTFLTMSYIIFVQPAILSGRMFGMDTGMPFEAVMAATCLSAAIACLIMGLYANYPIAQAPGMGENFFFIFSVLPATANLAVVRAGTTTAWQVALGVVLISGILFLILSLTRIRAHLMDAVSSSLKNGIAVGIGVFIAFIGLRNAGLILTDPGTAVKLNPHFLSPDLLIFFGGLVVTVALQARGVRGAILWGILVGVFLAALGHHGLSLAPEGGVIARWGARAKLLSLFDPTWRIIGRPPSVAPLWLKCDWSGALAWSMLPYIVIFLFMDVFDTLGTLIGVSQQANLLVDGKLLRARQAMLSDAIGTVVGACLGTSTVTSYIESATGVSAGGRTGWTAITVAGLFLLALFFEPLVRMVGSYPPITAPALVVVGALMMKNVSQIAWDDSTEALPAFMALVGIPLTYSIGDGLALGFIVYPPIKLLAGRGREIHITSWILFAVLLSYFIGIRAML